MQEEVNQKTVALVINATKITASVLKHAIQKKLQKDGQKHANKKSQKQAKRQETHYRGKMKVKELQTSGAGLSNIEITDKNIKSFERIARKYGIEYALKKDRAREPPRYVVLFRGKDTEVVNLAFKDYLAGEMKRNKKPSIKKRLQHYKELAAKSIQKSKSKTKEMEL